MFPILTNIFQMGWNHQLEMKGFQKSGEIRSGWFSVWNMDLFQNWKLGK